MRRLREKLRSQAGASLALALLLFLVCAVVGSVVLVAGTAASGRLSDLRQMDQRYYCVTSAAEFLRDALDGQSVQEIHEIEMQSILDEDGVEGDLSPVGDETVRFVPSGTDQLLADAAERCRGMTGEQVSMDLSLTLNKGTEILDTANIRETVKKNGTILFDVSNVPEEGDAGPYTLRLTYQMKTGSTEITRSEPSISMDEDGGTVSYIETATTLLSWDLTGIRVISGAEQGVQP